MCGTYAQEAEFVLLSQQYDVLCVGICCGLWRIVTSPSAKFSPGVQAVPDGPEDLRLPPALRQFLDGLAEILAQDLHRKGFTVSSRDGESMLIVESDKC